MTCDWGKLRSEQETFWPAAHNLHSKRAAAILPQFINYMDLTQKLSAVPVVAEELQLKGEGRLSSGQAGGFDLFMVVGDINRVESNLVQNLL